MTRSVEEVPPRWACVVMALFAVGAAWVRMRGLAGPSLWFDEINTLMRADASSPLGVVQNELRDVQAPLHDLLTWAVTRLFGDGEWATRLPAALFGAALVPATWALARATFGGIAPALVAAPLVAFAPVLVTYGREGRPYALFALLAALVLLAATRIVRSGGERGARLLAWSGPALLLTHYYGAPLLLAVALALLWHLGALRERLGRVVAAFLPAIAAGLLWSPIALWQFTRGIEWPPYASMGGRELLAALDSWTLEGAAAYRGDLARCWWIEIALAAIGAWMLLAGRRDDAPAPALATLSTPPPLEDDARRLRRAALLLAVAGAVGLLVAAAWPQSPVEKLGASLLRGGRALDDEGRIFVARLRVLAAAAGALLLLAGAFARALPALARRSPPARRADPLLLLALALPLIGAIVAHALGTPTFTTRHSIYAAAPIAVLAAGAIAAPRRFALGIALAGLLVAGSARELRPRTPVHEHPDFRGVGAVLRSWPDDPPFFHPRWIGRCAEHYAGLPWRTFGGGDDVAAARAFAQSHDRFVLVSAYEHLGSSEPVRQAVLETHRLLQVERYFGVACERMIRR
jgi:4-amino-4-deoxy-L-arabinose transferase-like glycosyltransferase